MRKAALFLISVLVVAAPATGQIGVPSPPNSSVCLVVCPRGNAISTIVVRDALDNPIPGSVVVVDFAGAPGLRDCNGAPLVRALGTTNLSGVLTLQLHASGKASGGGAVFADGIPIASSAPVAGTDQNGDGVVDHHDAQMVAQAIGGNDRSADLDCDGQITFADVQLVQQHTGDSCPGTVHTQQPTSGAMFELDVPLGNTPLQLQLTDGSMLTAQVVGDALLRLGPRISPNAVQVELVRLSGGAEGFVWSGGATGQLDLFLPEGPPVLGTLDGAGALSIGPTRWVLGSSYADSTRGDKHPTAGAHTVATAGDTVEITVTGTIQPAGNNYAVSLAWQGAGLPATEQYIGIASCAANVSLPLLAPHFLTCERCFKLCVQPLILSDDDGSKPGVSDARLQELENKAKAIWDGCCIRLEFMAPIKCKSTALNSNYPWTNNDADVGKFEKAVDDVLKAQGVKRPKECVLVVFAAGGGGTGGPNGGGLSEKGGDFTAIGDNHGTDDCKTKRDARAMAHELGHNMGLPDRPAGDNVGVMSSCAPTDSVPGSVRNGAIGTLADDCKDAHKARGKVQPTDIPCFEVGTPRKCDKKKTCCPTEQ